MAYRQRGGHRYNTPPPSMRRSGCPLLVLPLVVLWAVRRDYGPQGACAPKAALLVLVPVVLARAAWKLVRR